VTTPAGAARDDAARRRQAVHRLPFSHGYRREHHRSWASGRARASVFGLSDGLVSNLALVAGVAGASSARADVLVGGFAGLVAGALSMAIGEFVSMSANKDLLRHQLDIERREIENDPAGETLELAGLYEERGVDRTTALAVANQMMGDPDVALDAHAREELGIDPHQLGSPIGAATASFASFAGGAAVPLLPWAVAEGSAAVVASLVLGLAAAFALGAWLGKLAGRRWVRTATRQCVLVAVAFVITNLVGRLVGAAV
jgi:VIT1/CCC1 family predicted Fe2+/Mn2+ transporter